MNDKQLYQQTFSKLHTSKDYLSEVKAMKRTPKFYLPKVAVAAIAALTIFGSSAGVYAANIGGIQHIVQVWMHGNLTNATLTIQDDGSYDLSYQDATGALQEQSGGGIAIEADGTQRNLTEQEILEDLNTPMPDVEYLTDGRVMLIYKNQVLNITDKFKDGYCYITLDDGENKLYMTVEYKGGYASSSYKYILPNEFETGGNQGDVAYFDADEFDRLHPTN